MHPDTPSIRRSTLEPGIEHVVLDVPDKSANVFTSELLAELSTTLDALEASPPALGCILTSAKPGIYVAGADLVAISQTQHWNEKQVKSFCHGGQSLFERLSSLPCVTVAAIHGVCVGGGLEFALACDYLVASDDRKTLLGLPEVTLGLIPGWAGTVRTPRRIGVKAGIDLVTSGRLVAAQQALDMRLIDVTASADQLVARSAALIHEIHKAGSLAARRSKLRQATALSASERTKLSEEFETAITGRELHPYAPRVALVHMLDSAGDEFSVACDKEAAAMARVYGSESNAGLLNAFFLNDRAKKSGKFAGIKTNPINCLGIVGVGVMGGDIALACSNRLALRLLDSDMERSQLVAKSCNSPSGSGKPVVVAQSTADLQSCDLVIESIVEDVSAKKRLLADVESHVAASTIVASNTSVIRIAELSSELNRPDRFCGLHFCYPAKDRRLVEVIRGPETADEPLASVCDWVRSMGKVPLPMKDAPGFVINRLLCPMFNETGHLLTDGCTAEQIEQAMRDFGFALGPLEFMDAIGLDTLYAAGAYLIPKLTTPVEPSLLLHAMNKAGWKGRKAGRGFYDYPSADGRAQTNPDLPALIEQYAKPSGRTLSPDEIVRRLLTVMLNQAADLLAECVVPHGDDVDLALLLGGGFPPFRGGLLFWARRQRLAALEADVAQWGAEPSLRRRYRVSPNWALLKAEYRKPN
jgi:3-hydroxyacyl-CoA dehydrogenase/enoyl-CoA hydratase/carnithine racemase